MLTLASSSPRRRELLARVGIVFDVRVPEVDESVRPGEAPLAYVRRVAASKADAVSGQVVLAADTIVEIDGIVLGKAGDEAEARAMLARLVGRTHRVTTAFSVRGPDDAYDDLVTTDVDMVAATPDELRDYVASGEWRGKAGAYAAQGIAAALVAGVRGSITNVIGLPLAEVVAVLRRFGVAPRFAAGAPS